MQRITSLAACRELGGLAAFSPGVSAWTKGSTCSKQPAEHRRWEGVCVRPARPLTGEPVAQGRRLCRRRFVFAGQKHRLFSSQTGASGPPKKPGSTPDISVVGIPDPITWIRCKVTMYWIQLIFELNVDSDEFHRGVKQALVHISNLMANSRYHMLVGVVSNEMRDYVEKKCEALTKAQRRHLEVTMEDIIFMLPEDVSIEFDETGRKFCHVIIRFWLLSSHEGPDDPEGTKIFRLAPSEDDGPQKKIATAVYEFHGELMNRNPPNWTVTTVWHWHWNLAK